MGEEYLQEKLCKGVEASEEDDGFGKIEKVLAPFLRTLKKRKHEKADVIPTDYEELYLKKNTQELLDRLQHAFSDPVQFRTLLNETAELLKVVTKSKSVNLYLADYDSMELLLCPKFYQDNPRLQRKYTIGTYLAAHVAFTKEYVISSDILGDVRFPQGIPDVPVVKSAICLPVLTNVEGNCIGVIELYRECSEKPYDIINLQICNALMAWVGIAIEQCNLRLNLTKEQEIYRQLCTLTDLYFSGVIPFNKVLSDFIKVAKRAVNAERGAFYFFQEPVRPNTSETLSAAAFEEGLGESKKDETVLYERRDKVRFSVNKPGIPGYAARTAEVINIQDAYKDHRFDRKSDSPFYRTRSVIAIPVKNDTGVLGVLTLVNSLSSSHFQLNDIDLIKSFSGYFNIICQYSILEKNCSKAHLRLVLKDKLLNYHSKAPVEDLTSYKTVIQVELPLPPAFLKFEWEFSGCDEDVMKTIAAAFTAPYIFESVFEPQNLADFILRVKKAHRHVSYHNFDHAIYVLHYAFNVIYKNKDAFTILESIAVLVTAFCHDVDHQGFTNSFLTLKNDVIYNLHGEFCGETHRYEFVLFLIQQTDLLSNFSDEQFQTIAKHIKKLMLSFDLALHFQYRHKIVSLINDKLFNWEDPEHRFLSQTILLMCADNAISFKNFEVVRKNTVLLYKELQKQGDMEKSMGFTPLPMLNRSKNELVPENQYIYLIMVVAPCVEILVNLFPNLIVLIELIHETVLKWNELVMLTGQETWKITHALPRDKKDRKAGHKVTLASTLSSLKTIFSDTRSEKF